MTNNIQIFNNPSVDLLQVCEVDFKNVPCRGWVYVLEYGNGVVKIGCTKKLVQRYQNLVHSGADYGNVQFGRMALSPACVNYRNMESYLHRHFAEYRKQGTELFNVSLEDVVTQISKFECNFDFDGQSQKESEEFEKMKSSIISFWESEKDREDKTKFESAKEFLSKMPSVFSLDNDDFGEIRIGADVNTTEAYVSLAMNHFENPQEWGGQPLTPDTAIALSSLLLTYAMIAKKSVPCNNQPTIHPIPSPIKEETQNCEDCVESYDEWINEGYCIFHTNYGSKIHLIAQGLDECALTISQDDCHDIVVNFDDVPKLIDTIQKITSTIVPMPKDRQIELGLSE